MPLVPAPPHPRWTTDGVDWPHRARSSFLRAGGLDWHLQRMGEGPPLLLLHGTGASTHSMRALLPLLATRFDVLAPDLPGHGFTATPPPHLLSLPDMARLVGALLDALGISPAYAVGHSAGAAILLRAALDRRIAPTAIMSLNGALLPPPGVQAPLFPLAARALAALPGLPALMARAGTAPARLDRLLDGTGSRLDAEGRAFYARLFRRPDHVAGALGMMARWDLAALKRDLPRLRRPVTLVSAANDRMIPPAQANAVRALLPAGATLVELPGLGHLAHEEDPAAIAALVFAMADAHPVAASA
ncbi:MAG: alpha/beta fold hydrolase [Gluconacetobacter diazotrophicus]|nr:alpha/beta fold hydrolase [Gluconacetobacter diazotrophicus]